MTKSKVNAMFKILAERGIHAEALHKALRAFKDAYPHLNKFQITAYYYEAITSSSKLGVYAFMQRDKKYPCPFDDSREKHYKCRKGNTCKSQCMGMAY